MRPSYAAKKFKAEVEKGVKEVFSEKQLQEHYKLYNGYINKSNELEKEIDSLTADDFAKANGTYSKVGELNRGNGFARNASKLHEHYFAVLGGNGKCEGDIKKLIEEDYGSYEKMLDHFKASGLAARGWVVLAFDWDDMKLHVYATDYHTQGIWGSSPLLVMDIYEHAYFLDYQTARKAYIDKFFSQVDWSYCNAIIKEHKIFDKRKLLAGKK